MVEVFKEQLVRRYHAPTCSLATVACVVLAAATALLPFYFAFASQGFWLREDVYYEQPAVSLTHDVAVLAHVKASQRVRPLRWTSSAVVNRNLGAAHRSMTFQAAHVDDNHDGIADSLALTLDLPLAADEQLHALFVAVGATLQLQDLAKLSVDALLVAQHESPLPGTGFVADCDVEFAQRNFVLGRGGPVEPYAGSSLFPSGALAASSAQWTVESLVARARQRNYTTNVRCPAPLWQAGDMGNASRSALGALAPSTTFRANLTVRIPRQPIRYFPTVSRMLKHAWIEYFAILVLVFVVMDRVKYMLYRFQVLETQVVVDGAVAVHRGRKVHTF